MKRDEAIRWLLDQEPTSKWDIRPHKEKRSLSQNAYYWVILSKMAERLHMSKNEMHNRLLRSYGQILIIDGMTATTYLPDTEEAEEQTLQAETYHVRPTATVITDAKNRQLRAYYLLKGSHDYDSGEMAALLAGTVDEAKAMEIETLTPDELERMHLHEKAKEDKRDDH